MVDLGTLGGTASYAFAVNDGGQAVGDSHVHGDATHGFSWTKEDGMVDLGTLGGIVSHALAVNELGQVVGYSFTPSADVHAVLWRTPGP